MTGNRPALSMVARGLLAAIRAYQRHLSPRKPPVCRFIPTCSSYMRQAIEYYGAWRGLWIGLRRLARCHPWSPGGYDPVPGTAPDDAPQIHP